LNPEENIKEAYAEINEMLEKLKREDRELKIEVKTLLKAASAAIPREKQICISLAGAIRKALKRDVKYWMTPGFIDMRYFMHDRGIPIVSYGPGGLTHVANESVAISDVMDCIKVLSTVAMDLLE